jgi:ribonuclease BN (tRNA processing enzyme)
MSPDLSRRTFVQAAAAALVAPPWMRRGRAGARTRLILLGTAGGPRPRMTRAAPAQVIVVDDRAFVIDCGNGVARQLILAGVPLAQIQHLFLTHQHSDHNADLGTLLLLAWTSGLRTPVGVWGPPPLARMTDQFFAMQADEIATRIADEGRVPLRPLVQAHDVSAGGLLFEAGGVRVTGALVQHPPVTPAFAYRFDTPDRSIVISGDTLPSDNLIALARGADVLVHEAMVPSAVDRLVANVPNASRLRDSILAHHTSVEEAGRVAEAAGVRTLVLSHLIPAEDPLVTDAQWLAGARTHFRGTVIVGRDLLEL